MIKRSPPLNVQVEGLIKRAFDWVRLARAATSRLAKHQLLVGYVSVLSSALA
jgi:hypothetical protein